MLLLLFSGFWVWFVFFRTPPLLECNCSYLVISVVGRIVDDDVEDEESWGSPGTGKRRAWSSARWRAARIWRARPSSLLANCVRFDRISCTRCFWKALIYINTNMNERTGKIYKESNRRTSSAGNRLSYYYSGTVFFSSVWNNNDNPVCYKTGLV